MKAVIRIIKLADKVPKGHRKTKIVRISIYKNLLIFMQITLRLKEINQFSNGFLLNSDMAYRTKAIQRN
jgi:hypothetical protein